MPGPKKLTKLSLRPLFHEARCASVTELACMLGVELSRFRGQFYRGVDIYRADQYAVALNVHPVTVWGDEFYGPYRQESAV